MTLQEVENKIPIRVSTKRPSPSQGYTVMDPKRPRYEAVTPVSTPVDCGAEGLTEFTASVMEQFFTQM